MTAAPPALQAGLDALRRGDAPAAGALLEEAVRALPAGSRPWLQLAQARRLAGDLPGELDALDALLRDEPRHIPGLLIMGERRREANDDRAAASFFRAALNQARVAPPPPQLAPMLQRAEAFLGEAQARYERHLLGSVDLPPASPTGPATRFGRSVDLMLGRRELHLQQPSMFYFPELPQRQFYERDEFPWAAALEARAREIRAEMDALTEEFAPYVTGEPGRPRPATNPLLDDPSWGAFYLWQGGRPTEGAARCPRTMAALADLPIPRIAGRSPMALFSRLKPGAHIRPHHGLLNTRLICHLPLAAPPGCAIRVGDEVREWREGELLIFDDSVEHEAWNRGEGVRTVLLFEVWRPEVTPDERRDLTRLFEAVDAYGGFPEPTGADH